jgi:hypothetical protein
MWPGISMCGGMARVANHRVNGFRFGSCWHYSQLLNGFLCVG